MYLRAKSRRRAAGSRVRPQVSPERGGEAGRALREGDGPEKAEPSPCKRAPMEAGRRAAGTGGTGNARPGLARPWSPRCPAHNPPTHRGAAAVAVAGPSAAESAARPPRARPAGQGHAAARVLPGDVGLEEPWGLPGDVVAEGGARERGAVTGKCRVRPRSAGLAGNASCVEATAVSMGGCWRSRAQPSHRPAGCSAELRAVTSRSEQWVEGEGLLVFVQAVLSAVL